ncbi:MAG TPA: TIGR00374 family protein [Porphyromonadaceae bacterium]|jgi:hypothetical protein|uniref:lysylphosphatidylglycerol synthase transmembrane domain-containing protein n=1 Tax=Limibacterium fermenti TaxID=3229863 RepID=UPI000E86FBE2|nr:TIGR00374 family protein [Porphyromonadaceae bacterium]HBL35116.1 TIGR00374 family protein [Porphyromonadaceae bacterium]HBX19304.1 TIGR00374 family protein [Porphyromonadaceae bacterium]HBX45201.1 TIGR00374 family protein [Porphyromonadaceae bacterium]HCM20421.1 TIGR00374 family protein [Porphyromonadaceae bacterium]
MNKKSIKNIFKTLLSLLLGLAIIWLLYRKTDMQELWSIVKSAHFEIIAFSLIFGLAGNILRGLRWELLINSLGYYPARASIIYATLGNYAVNFLLPRAGDFWRCGVVSKYDQIPFSKTFETYLVDRVLDLVAAMVVVVISIILYVDFFISYFETNPHYAENIVNLFRSVWIYVLGGLLIFGCILLFTVFKDTPWMKKVRGFFVTLKHDMKLIAKMKKKNQIIIYTILLWLSFYLYFYICFYAFDFTKHLGLLAGWIVFAMSNIGVAVPVQGGIGAWHFMVISSLVILGVPYDQAGAFAGTVFTIQSVWVILYGVFGVLAMPYVKRGVNGEV